MQSADLTLTLPESMQLPTPDYEGYVDREEVLSWRVDPVEGVVGFLSLVAGDRERCVEVATDLDAIDRFDVAPIDDETFYAYAEIDLRDADASLMAPFDDGGLVVVPPIVYEDSSTVRVTALGTDDALSGLLDRFPDGVGVEVERVGDHDRLSGSLASRLTRRQFEALSVARELGYYEVPREAPLSAVADALGCSESAASTLLRTAQANLVDAALAR
ncbi:helix-turn-helix domain-containing protein [Natronoarchaeum philippinense]|uniref:helix-turn-helix domain-containing protein n=1 Tax=Natronoarchaeum philippinense TaxID=558529 RepID=UPI000BE2C634|nr:helix-turn-helix domain-containing protein [Natronoarchaeum philippinense]